MRSLFGGLRKARRPREPVAVFAGGYRFGVRGWGSGDFLQLKKKALRPYAYGVANAGNRLYTETKEVKVGIYLRNLPQEATSFMFCQHEDPVTCLSSKNVTSSSCMKNHVTTIYRVKKSISWTIEMYTRQGNLCRYEAIFEILFDISKNHAERELVQRDRFVDIDFESTCDTALSKPEMSGVIPTTTSTVQTTTVIPNNQTTCPPPECPVTTLQIFGLFLTLCLFIIMVLIIMVVVLYKRLKAFGKEGDAAPMEATNTYEPPPNFPIEVEKNVQEDMTKRAPLPLPSHVLPVPEPQPCWSNGKMSSSFTMSRAMSKPPPPQKAVGNDYCATLPSCPSKKVINEFADDANPYEVPPIFPRTPQGPHRVVKPPPPIPEKFRRADGTLIGSPSASQTLQDGPTAIRPITIKPKPIVPVKKYEAQTSHTPENGQPGLAKITPGPIRMPHRPSLARILPPPMASSSIQDTDSEDESEHYWQYEPIKNLIK